MIYEKAEGLTQIHTYRGIVYIHKHTNTHIQKDRQTHTYSVEEARQSMHAEE